MVETGEYLFAHEFSEAALHLESGFGLQGLEARFFEGVTAAQLMQESIFTRCQAPHVYVQRRPREQHTLPGQVYIQILLRSRGLTVFPDGEHREARTEGPRRRLVAEMQFRLQFTRYRRQGRHIHGRMGRRQSRLQTPPFERRHVAEIRQGGGRLETAEEPGEGAAVVLDVAG